MYLDVAFVFEVNLKCVCLMLDNLRYLEDELTKLDFCEDFDTVKLLAIGPSPSRFVQCCRCRRRGHVVKPVQAFKKFLETNVKKSEKRVICQRCICESSPSKCRI